MPSYEALRAHFAAFGQEHVFAGLDRLDEPSRARLLDQAAGIDLEALQRVQQQLRTSSAHRSVRLQPVDVERLPAHGGDPARAATARRRGEAMLRAGRVAALMVAGGQGSRLDFDGPKGAFPIGPVSGRSLFEIHAQKLRNLRRRTAQPLPWCVMTSPATDAATREFFADAGFFGLPQQDVLFFCQGMVPSMDFDGRLLLAEPDRIFENPDGHGGTLIALLASGVLEELERRGIDTIFYYQVDNPLVQVCDPVYLGFHEAAEAEISCKVVQKVDPDEKVGIVAQVNGEIGMVEYTELGEVARTARSPNGELQYWAGNIAVHLFSTAVVRRVAADAENLLPFHASEKKIPHVDAEGRLVKPDTPNGRKLERFVFDALSAASGVCVVETDRGVEFSPVKNATGADSPATARRDLVASYRTCLTAAGIALPDGDVAIEIDHSEIDGPEDVARLGLQTLADAGDIIRIGSGVSA
jgi:UDP-N-acetylglucosamine/UDP-N-acetylgalactosamine diphosphorylase